MIGLIRLFLGSLVGLFRSRAEMAAENLPLRHQLGILLRSRPVRLPLTSWDRALWAYVLHRFPEWRQSLAIVRPETVIAWRRQAFRLFWRRKSQAGRPRAHAEVRRLIREMASDNPTWGAPRIHGELLKLGFDVSERTGSRYLERNATLSSPRCRRPPSGSWRLASRSRGPQSAAGRRAFSRHRSLTATASSRPVLFRRSPPLRFWRSTRAGRARAGAPPPTVWPEMPSRGGREECMKGPAGPECPSTGRGQNASAAPRKRQNCSGFTRRRPPAIPIAPLHDKPM